ncbi:MAG: hypothetical protein ACK412_08410 [Chloroherpetonaceae bacterium]
MTIVAREPLAKSEVEIAVANVATLLVLASRVVSGEVVPNFEAIVEQNEMSFAQKRKDVLTVQALLSDEDGVVDMLQKTAETIRNLHALLEAIHADAIPAVQVPAKPLPEDSLLRDTLRRLQYVQKVIESAAKWINDVGKHEHLKGSVLFTKTQQKLIRSFKRVVIQLQQAAVMIGKYRDMGDILLLREMTLDAHTVLSELKDADESVSEKRKSISFFKRAIEESKAAPKIVRQLASVTAGLVIVLMLSFAIIKLNALAPQVFPISEPVFEAKDKSSVEHEIQTPVQRTHAQEERIRETPIKSETETKLKEVAPPIKNEASIANETRRKEIAPASTKLAPTTMSLQAKPKVKKPEVSVAQAKKSALVKTDRSASEDKLKSSDVPAVEKAANKHTEKTAEEKNTSLKISRESEATSQNNLERTIPKRKTIVIEE